MFFSYLLPTFPTSFSCTAPAHLSRPRRAEGTCSVPADSSTERGESLVLAESPADVTLQGSRAGLESSQHLHKSFKLANPGDAHSHLKELIYIDSDLVVTPIIDNPKILKPAPVRFDPKTLSVNAFPAEKLASLNDQAWDSFVQQLCSSLGQSDKMTGAPRTKLNLLCYLCSVSGHKEAATRLINSQLFLSLTHVLRTAPNWDVRAKVIRVIGLLSSHAVELNEDVPVTEALCRITRHSASAFHSMIDQVGLPAILNSLVCGISRVQQHMLTMFSAVLASGVHLQLIGH
ncbi:serine/threonine-protein kinase ULK4 isoform X2 [Amia ocellicauda]|uniref:serine/threonine-protein kinase ULK4 isoform X2 n=1 Tax=Amia ocellicauda TaxID=2972642 RepID=UPI003463E3CD